MNDNLWNDGYGDYRAANTVAQTAQASPVELVLMLVDGLLEEMARLGLREQRSEVRVAVFSATF